MTSNFRKVFNLTKSRQLDNTPAHLLPLVLLGRDPEENDQQPEYDDFVAREQKGKGIYIPFDKNETNRTGKLVPLLINLSNYLDPSKFGKDFEGYTRERLHWHLHQAKS